LVLKGGALVDGELVGGALVDGKIVDGELDYGTTEVRGTSWAWRRQGRGQLDVVLVHGWQNDGSAWQPFVDRLDPSCYRTTVVDLPGCGASPLPGSWARSTIDELAHDLAVLVEVWHIDPAVVVGHSLGGAIALVAALEHPELLRGLVLVAPASTSGLDFLDDDQFERLLAPDAEERAALVRAAFHRPLPREAVAALNDVVARAHPDHVAGGARSMRSLQLHDRLPSIALPALLVAGDRDRHVPIRNHLQTWQHLPRCGLQVFHDVGHVPFWEVPDAFAEVVDRFLARFVDEPGGEPGGEDAAPPRTPAASR
jgi:pimeloyl-ACP methyl ester carboxylesterase